MNSEKQYVWYACYGSNLLREGSLLYIQGGTKVFEGVKNTKPGCRDHSLPADDRPHILHHRLYFAGPSGSWGGGVAFVETRREESVTTYGRIYKVTREQLEDIRAQEGPGDKWYGNNLLIGTVDGLPVYTLARASQYDGVDKCPPSAAYRKVIARGLAETFPSVNVEEYLGHAAEVK